MVSNGAGNGSGSLAAQIGQDYTSVIILCQCYIRHINFTCSELLMCEANHFKTIRNTWPQDSDLYTEV